MFQYPVSLRGGLLLLLGLIIQREGTITSGFHAACTTRPSFSSCVGNVDNFRRRNRLPSFAMRSDPSDSDSKDELAGGAPSEDESDESEASSQQPAAAAIAQETDEEESSYPIDLPSPILLATSIVLAIASTGSLFELIGGDPKLGAVTSAGIAVVGFPVCLFLFYAAIVKAKAETEEDDERFLKNR